MHDMPKPSFRIYAVVFWLFIFGLAMFAHGCVGWMEGSVVIRSKNSPSYLATPGGATATSFYAYTVAFMIIGLLASLGAILLAWSVLFASPSQKAKVIHSLSQPLKGRKSPAVPTWLFWSVIAVFISVFVFAAIR